MEKQHLRERVKQQVTATKTLERYLGILKNPTKNLKKSRGDWVGEALTSPTPSVDPLKVKPYIN